MASLLFFFNQASNFSTKLEFYVLQDSFSNNAEVIRRHLLCRLATMNPKICKNICRLGSISGQQLSWMLSFLFVRDKKMSKILCRLLKVILLQEVDFVFSLFQSIQKTIIHTLSVHIRIISRNETWFKSVSLHEHQTNKSWRCLLAVSPKVASRTGFCYKTWATLQSHFPHWTFFYSLQCFGTCIVENEVNLLFSALVHKVACSLTLWSLATKQWIKCVINVINNHIPLKYYKLNKRCRISGSYKNRFFKFGDNTFYFTFRMPLGPRKPEIDLRIFLQLGQWCSSLGSWTPDISSWSLYSLKCSSKSIPLSQHKNSFLHNALINLCKGLAGLVVIVKWCIKLYFNRDRLLHLISPLF